VILQEPYVGGNPAPNILPASRSRERVTTQRFPDDLFQINTEIGRRFTRLLLWFGRVPNVLSTSLSRRLTHWEKKVL